MTRNCPPETSVCMLWLAYNVGVEKKANKGDIFESQHVSKICIIWFTFQVGVCVFFPFFQIQCVLTLLHPALLTYLVTKFILNSHNDLIHSGHHKKIIQSWHSINTHVSVIVLDVEKTKQRCSQVLSLSRAHLLTDGYLFCTDSTYHKRWSGLL